MAEDSLQTLEVPPPDPSTPHRVFLEVSLKEGLYPMMPHSMYCLPLWPGITLVLLTKVCGCQHTTMHRVRHRGHSSDTSAMNILLLYEAFTRALPWILEILKNRGLESFEKRYASH